MSRYRASLPQLSGELFLSDAGIETDLIFNHGIEIREFAAHRLAGTEVDMVCGTDLRHVRRIAEAISDGFTAR